MLIVRLRNVILMRKYEFGFFTVYHHNLLPLINCLWPVINDAASQCCGSVSFSLFDALDILPQFSAQTVKIAQRSGSGGERITDNIVDKRQKK